MQNWFYVGGGGDTRIIEKNKTYFWAFSNQIKHTSQLSTCQYQQGGPTTTTPTTRSRHSKIILFCWYWYIISILFPAPSLRREFPGLFRKNHPRKIRRAKLLSTKKRTRTRLCKILFHTLFFSKTFHSILQSGDPTHNFPETFLLSHNGIIQFSRSFSSISR